MNRMKTAIAVIAGLVLGPAVAMATTSAFSPSTSTPSTTTVADTQGITQVEATTTTFAATSSADLEAACGDDGLVLVAAEQAGTATDIQLAALAALRDVCDAAGMPLPAAPDAVVEEIVIFDTSALPGAGGTYGDHHDDDEYEDDEYEEHEEHEEHEEEHEEHD